jgi:hypothetical protein
MRFLNIIRFGGAAARPVNKQIRQRRLQQDIAQIGRADQHAVIQIGPQALYVWQMQQSQAEIAFRDAQERADPHLHRLINDRGKTLLGKQVDYWVQG